MNPFRPTRRTISFDAWSFFAIGIGLFAFDLAFPESVSLAQDATRQAATPKTSDAEAAIRQSAKDYIEASKQGDAKAVAQLWTKDGVYVDTTGHKFQGREAIEEAFKRFFSAHKVTDMEVTIDSIRMLNPSTAIEEGSSVTVSSTAGVSSGAKYVAIHVKQDNGRWLLASVRDTPLAAKSNAKSLKLLDLLTGNWSVKHRGVQIDISSQWNPTKTFLERRFITTRDGKVTSSSTEIVGWDPMSQQITSWTFNSDGARSSGVWKPLEDGWVVQNRGITANGNTTYSTDAWAPLLGDALGWHSTRRSVGGVPLNDSNPVVLKRSKAKSPAKAKTPSEN